MILNSIRDYVFHECQAASNRFGTAFWEQHIMVMRQYALQLAEYYQAEREIVDLAAYLHDLAALQDYEAVSQHHLLGTLKAQALLEPLGCPVEKILRVLQCIRTHSSPVLPGSGSPEEVCISHADAMAQIARPVYWLWYTFQVRALDYEQGRQWYLNRIKRHWVALGEPAKEMVQTQYFLAKSLLE
jgi:uncharacterized protein